MNSRPSGHEAVLRAKQILHGAIDNEVQLDFVNARGLLTVVVGNGWSILVVDKIIYF
ncbi:MAG: hypothetical protein Q7R95_08180 [bacterium]|nr:hypothetical protein [bacterium]